MIDERKNGKGGEAGKKVQKAPDALLFALESPHVLKDIKPKKKDMRVGWACVRKGERPCRLMTMPISLLEEEGKRENTGSHSGAIVSGTCRRGAKRERAAVGRSVFERGSIETGESISAAAVTMARPDGFSLRDIRTELIDTSIVIRHRARVT
ncbi:hypothetical protein ALC56_11294 [Trachymyrmex septentrionalis]|uniref:Uncharacterized protein n=1 Tax=Trachymyrmex septentrionalis TaxID=34720 RepID=A0A195F147_9HYME|nr:hypothetical protein ALC56_11294 [Trachymyrmex septentrionalis]